LVYGFSSILARLLNFLLIPLYTYYFLPQEYAIITDFYSIMALFSVVLAFSIDSFYFRVQRKIPIDTEELSTIQGEKRVIIHPSHFLFNQCMSFLVLINTVFLALTLLNAQTLAEYLDYPDHKNWVILCVLILFFDTFSVLPLAVLRSEKKAWRFSAINTSMIFLNIGCNLLYFLYLKPQYNLAISPASVVFGINLMASIFRFILLLPNCLHYTPQFNWDFWSQMIPYAAPLVLVSIGGIINEVIDRQLLKYLLLETHSKEEMLYQVGIYGAVYKFSIFITLINQAFRYAVEPFLLRRYDEKPSKQDLPKSRQVTLELHIQLMNVYVGILLFCFLSITFFSDLLKHIFLANPAYWQGLKILPILLLAHVCLGVYYLQSIWYRLAMVTQIGAHISWIGVLITVIINFIFIPQYGYVASAWATLFCYFSMLVISYFWSQSYLAIPYTLKKIGYYFAVALYFYYIVQHSGLLEYVFADQMAGQIGGKLFFLALYAGILFRLEYPNSK